MRKILSFILALTIFSTSVPHVFAASEVGTSVLYEYNFNNQDDTSQLPDLHKTGTGWSIQDGVLKCVGGFWTGPNGWTMNSQSEGVLRISFDFLNNCETTATGDDHLMLTQKGTADGFATTNLSLLSFMNASWQNQIGVANDVNNSGNLGKTVVGSWYTYTANVDMDNKTVSANVVVKTPADGSDEVAGTVLGSAVITTQGGGRIGYPKNAEYFDTLTFVGNFEEFYIDNLKVEKVIFDPNILIDDDFSSFSKTVSYLSDSEGSYTVEDGVLKREAKWTNQFGLTFAGQTEGKLELTFDFNLSDLGQGVIGGIGTTTGNVAQNVLAPLYMHNANGGHTMSAGRFANDPGPIPAPKTDVWYTCESIIDLTNKSLETEVFERDTGTLLGSDSNKGMTPTDGFWHGWAKDENLVYNLFLTVGQVAGFNTIDNLKLKIIYDVPTVTDSQITVSSHEGTVEENLLSIDPAVDTVSVDFMTKLDEDTITTENIYVKDSEGVLVSQDISINNGLVTIKVFDCLKTNSEYILVVSENVANFGGDRLGENKEFILKTNGGKLSAVFSDISDNQTGLSAKVLYQNSTDKQVSPTFVTAYYGENNILKAFEIKNSDELKAAVKGAEINFAHQKNEENYLTYKIMLWDGLIPLANSDNNSKKSGKPSDEPLNINVSDGTGKGTLAVSGSGAASGDLISVVVLAGENMEVPTLSNDTDIAYIGDVAAGDDGSFNIEFALPESGKYSVFVTSREGAKTASETKVNFVNAAEYENVINTLNLLAENDKKTEFINTVKSNLFTLGVDDDYTALANVDKVAELLFNKVKSERLSAESKSANTKIWKNLVSIELLNSKKISNITPYIGDIIENSSLYQYYNNYVTEEQYKEYLTGKMSGIEILDIAELEDKYNEALILTVVKYPDGYTNIEKLFKDSKEITGISTPTSKKSVYQGLAGKTFKDLDDLLGEYNELENKKQTTAGGSSGSSSSSKKNSYIIPTTVTEETKKAEGVVKMPFTDLDTVMWAYEAISTLSDRGIVNGKSENEFKPREYVLREEFVKMILLALNYDVKAMENKFSDVLETDWFYPYVTYANSIALVRGKNDGSFGTSENIKRQDMAVMLYNALNISGYNVEVTGTTFSDSNEISDYAQKAVEVLSGLDVINGNGDGTFNPSGNATRAEAAQIIFNMLNVLE